MALYNSSGTTSSPSIVDVFENYLGCTLTKDTSKDINKLSKTQAAQLIKEAQRFLEAFTETIVPRVDSVLLDEFNDLTDLFSRRRALDLPRNLKQLVIYYPQLLVPWESIESVYEVRGRPFLKYLCVYISSLKPLLSNHIITPVSHEKLLPPDMEELAYDMALQNASRRFARFAYPHLPLIKGLPPHEVQDTLAAYLFGLYRTLCQSSNVGANPILTDYSSNKLLLYHFDKLSGLPFNRKTQPLHANSSYSLLSLRVPGIDNISIHDLVAIRLQSDDFFQWRRDLGSAIRKTVRDSKTVDDLEQLNETFQDNLALIVEQSKRMEREFRDKSLKKFLKSTFKTMSIGALSLLTSQQVFHILGKFPMDVSSDLIKLAPAAGLSFVWWLLFKRSKRNDKLLLKFYHSLSDKLES